MVLARIVNMRGVDLRRFEFDYDLTWAGFFFASDGTILGRFGGRDGPSPDKYLTLPGLKHAMKSAIDRNGRPAGKPMETALSETADKIRHVEDYPASRRLKANACIHCHQVYDFRRDYARSKNTFTREQIWVYPLPENLGFSIDPNQQNRITSVKADSPAAKAGLKAADELIFIDREHIASFADIQHALHVAPNEGSIRFTWMRNGKRNEAEVDLPARWRETDISWRESMWNLEPSASVYGKDLTEAEKKSLGLKATQVAFRQGDYVPPAAASAGIRKGDIILGIKGKELEMNMLQFNVYVRLNYKPGEKVVYEFLRGGKRQEAAVTLPKKTF